MNQGLPWVWWEIPNSSSADLPVVFLNTEILGLNLAQAQYLINNPSANYAIKQLLEANSHNQISKILARQAINEGLQGKPLQLQPIWVDHSANNNVNRIIVNLLEDKCLEQVFSKITKENYTNRLSEIIREFDANENVTIVMKEDNTLPANVYGDRKAIYDAQDNFKYYQIRLNPTALSGTSEEFIADVFFHEFIHAYLKEHLTDYDFENISQHTQMLGNYLDKMAEH